MSAELLREAATSMRSDWAEAKHLSAAYRKDPFWRQAQAWLAVADWLEMSANKWDQDFAATQVPSSGVDQPPGVHFGDPIAAAANADWHAGNALDVARAYLGRIEAEDQP